MAALEGPIVCLGPVGIDIVMEGYAPTDPDRLSTWAGPVEMRMLAAGSVGYAALALLGLGRAVTLTSTVGDDHLGAELIRQLEASGVDTSDIDVAPGPTSVAAYLRMFGDAKRPMVFRAGTYSPWPDALRALEIVDQHRPSALVISGLLHYPEYASAQLAPVAARATERGIPVIVDPQFPPHRRAQPWAEDLDDLLGNTSVLCCDEMEGDHLFGSSDVDEIIAAGRRHGISTVVVKREHLGSVVDDGESRLYQSAISLGAGVGSTIGSGDAFLAGLVDALLDGDSTVGIIARATAAASVAITAPDGIRGVTGAEARRWRTLVPAPQELRPHERASEHPHIERNGATE